MAFKKLKLWFDTDLAKLLADKTFEVEPNFNSKTFITSVSSKIDALELKDRVEVFADELHVSLNLPFDKSAEILMNILGPENEEETGIFLLNRGYLSAAGLYKRNGNENIKAN